MEVARAVEADADEEVVRCEKLAPLPVEPVNRKFLWGTGPYSGFVGFASARYFALTGWSCSGPPGDGNACANLSGGGATEQLGSACPYR